MLTSLAVPVNQFNKSVQVDNNGTTRDHRCSLQIKAQRVWPAMGALSSIRFEGYSAEELLALPVGDFDAYVFSDDALVIEIGSCSLLGKFSVAGSRLVLELAQIDGGGEGVLPALASLAKRVAIARDLNQVEWQVHAVHCAKPNLKLRRVLERRGFDVRQLPGIGEVYHRITDVAQP